MGIIDTFERGEIVKFRWPRSDRERGTAEVSFVANSSRYYVVFPGETVGPDFYYPEDLLKVSPLELLAEAAE